MYNKLESTLDSLFSSIDEKQVQLDQLDTQLQRQCTWHSLLHVIRLHTRIEPRIRNTLHQIYAKQREFHLTYAPAITQLLSYKNTPRIKIPHKSPHTLCAQIHNYTTDLQHNYATTVATYAQQIIRSLEVVSALDELYIHTLERSLCGMQQKQPTIMRPQRSDYIDVLLNHIREDYPLTCDSLRSEDQNEALVRIELFKDIQDYHFNEISAHIDIQKV